MQRLALAAALALAALALPASAAHAQEARQQVLSPEPIAADAPTAKRALGLVELLLAGDAKQAEAYLAAHGAASLTSGGALASTVAALIEELKQGPRVVDGQDGFGAAGGRAGVGVGVRLSTEAGAPPTRAVVVRMEADAPHRILDVRVAQIQIG